MFYKTCLGLTGPDEIAAFNTAFFLHGFVRDFRKKKDTPDFIEDQRRRLKKFDAKHTKSGPLVAAAPSIPISTQPSQETHPISTTPPSMAVPPAAALPIRTAFQTNPAALKKGTTPYPAATSAPLSMAAPLTAASSAIAASHNVPSTDVSATPAHILESVKRATEVLKTSRAAADKHTAISANTFQQHKNRKTRYLPTPRPGASTLPFATPGPGPSTIKFAAAAAKGIVRQPLITSGDLDLLDKIDEEDDTWRRFQDIEDSSGTDKHDPRPSVEIPTTDKKGKAKEVLRSKRKRGLVDYGSEESSSDCATPPTNSKKAKTNMTGKAIEKDKNDDDKFSEDDETSSSSNDSDDEFRVIHSRPRKPLPRTSHKPPVRINNNTNPSGEYHEEKCSKCRLSGKECEKQQSGGACVNCRRYKHKCEYARPRKSIKSKVEVESEEDEPSSMSSPEVRHPRVAAAAARRAIKKVVAAAKNPSKPPAKKPRTAGKRSIVIISYPFVNLKFTPYHKPIPLSNQ